MEIELKLAIPAGARRKIGRHPALRASPVRPRRREVTTYFDTPDLELATAGTVLRVRRAGGVFVQAVKAKSEAVGDGEAPAQGLAARRGEWQWKLDRETPNLDLAAGTPAALLLEGVAGRLEPIFATEIMRTAWTAQLDGGTEVEIVIDEGCIRSGNGSTPVRELEIELMSGPVAPIYQLALELHGLAPVSLAVESKAARGYRLRTGSPPQPVKPDKLNLPPGISLHDALKTVFGTCQAHLLANQAATVVGDDAEGLHQMRVALRRLRSALDLFKRHLEPYAASRFADECKRLGRVFGEARDWGVFVLEILPKAEADGVDIGRLRPLAQAELARDHEAVKQAIADPAFTGLMLALPVWIEGRSWPRPKRHGDREIGRPLAELAPSLLDRLARKTSGLGSTHLSRQPADKLHDLRKRLKKLRYGVDFLGGLYPSHAVKRYRMACEDLQALLGTLNDMKSTIAFAVRLAEGQTDELVSDAGALAAWAEARMEACRGGLDAAWAELNDARPFWR